MSRRPLVIGAAAAGLASVIVFHSGGSGAVLGSGPPATTTPLPSTGGGSGTTTPTTTSPSSAGGTRSAVGSLENYGYGQLAVKVTVQGTRITGLAVSTLSTAEPYSQSLAQQVIPMLRNEIISAQSARINAVSGATYTSEAYAYSVQAALDHLHVK